MAEKELKWVGSSRSDLLKTPEDIVDVFGFALGEAQGGRTHPGVKPMTRGVLKGKGIFEVLEDDDGNTDRCMYTVKLADTIYVLHCFQKKIEVGYRNAEAGHRFD